MQGLTFQEDGTTVFILKFEINDFQKDKHFCKWQHLIFALLTNHSLIRQLEDYIRSTRQLQYTWQWAYPNDDADYEVHLHKYFSAYNPCASSKQTEIHDI